MSTAAPQAAPRVPQFPPKAIDVLLHPRVNPIAPIQVQPPLQQYQRHQQLQLQRHQALNVRRPVSALSAGSTPAPTKDLDSGTRGNLGQRSTSFKTLQQSTIYQPRMSQLETLEAKMASIEVSLSNSPRRKKLLNGTSNHLASPTTNLNASMRSIPKDLALRELDALRNALRDKENIIQSLKGQLSIPGLRLQNLRNSSCSNSTGNLRELSEIEKKQAEERLTRLRNDTDTKRLAIKNLKMALERLDITDNIDVRIQQAELEYQLGREELNLLTLLEETRTLQHLLEECNKSSDVHTLYNCLSSSDEVSIHAVEINFDPKSPRFGASQKDSNPGVYVDWALEDSGLVKGDRFIEVNGKFVLTKSRDDLARLLSAAPDPALIVVLRYDKTGSCQVTCSSGHYQRELTALRCELDTVRDRADASQRGKDTVKTDNIRLTHRISYLEEQVSELTSRLKHTESLPTPDIRVMTQSPVITSTVKTRQNITNINISSQPASIISNCTSASSNGNSSGNDQATPQQKSQQAVQFQKGSQISTLVASHPGLDSSRETLTNLPVRSRSSLSNVSNTLIGDNSCNNSPNSKGHGHSKHRSPKGLQMSASSNELNQLNQRSHSANKTHHHHHHHHHREKDYNSETNTALDCYRDHHHSSRTRKHILENGISEKDYYNFGNSNYKQDGILTSGIQHSKSSPLLLANTIIDSNNLMDQNYRKATQIVQDLTRNGISKEFRDKGDRDYRDYRDSRQNEMDRDRHRNRERDREKEREAVNHLYEKHGRSGRCLTASEKYGGADALRQQMLCNKGRNSTSVLDFRSEIHIGPKYMASESKSAEDLDSTDAPTPIPVISNNSTSNTKRLFRKLHDARSIKSLDFDSDTSSYYKQHHQQTSITKTISQQQQNHLQSRMKQQQTNNTNYISEPSSNGYAHLNSRLPNGIDMLKSRPTPPKKPLRLSLHRAQSLQSVESAPPSTGGGGSPKQDKLDANGRKPIKRNHKGEGQVLSATEQAEFTQNGLMPTDNGNIHGYDIVSKENMSNLKWTTFNQSRSRENIIYANENGHWC